MKKSFFLILFLTGLSFVFTADKITIFIVGDSTAANKDTSGGKVERGWGQMLQNFFNKKNVVIKNQALNGRSSKSFINEGHWNKVKKNLKKGNYVLIQFGHNDEKTDSALHTEPGSTFDQYLSKYVKETKQLGGIPILMSPCARRKWSKGVLVDTHKAYRTVAKTVASKLNVLYIDGNNYTEKLETNLGEKGSKKLHMIYGPGEQPSLPNGIEDNTHYNIYGATRVAKIFAGAIVKVVPALKPYISTNSINLK